MRTLCIVPARRYCRHIEGRNMLRLKGKPLVGLAIEVGDRAGVFDDLVVLTDDVPTMAVAKRRNVEYLTEPPTVAHPDIYPVQACAWALTALGGSQKWDAVVCLYPSVPLRSPIDVKTAVGVMTQHDLDAVFSVTELPDYHNALAVGNGNDGIEPVWGDWVDLKAADVEGLPRFVLPNGAVIVIRAERLETDVSWFRGSKLVGYPVPWPRSLAIRSEDDLKIADLKAF